MNLNRIQQLVNGLKDSLRFSNGAELIWQRVARRKSPVVHYEWHKKWHLYCDSRFGDHGSVKEVLGQGVYDTYIRQSARGESLSYVNVGANVGSFDIAVAGMGLAVPHALTVELNPWTFTRLAFNMAVNQREMVRLCNAGIAGESGSIYFVRRKDSVNDSIYSDANKPGAESREMPLVTIEQALREAGLGDKTFDLLKLDAEGAEYEIVEKSRREVLRKFAHIVMELHVPPKNRDPEKLYAKLAECGFECGDPKWTPAEGLALRFWTRRD